MAKSEDAECRKEESLEVAQDSAVTSEDTSEHAQGTEPEAKSEDVEYTREESDAVVVQDHAVASEQALQQAQA
jgi:hypothetical protein